MPTNGTNISLPLSSFAESTRKLFGSGSPSLVLRPTSCSTPSTSTGSNTRTTRTDYTRATVTFISATLGAIVTLTDATVALKRKDAKALRTRIVSIRAKGIWTSVTDSRQGQRQKAALSSRLVKPPRQRLSPAALELTVSPWMWTVSVLLLGIFRTITVPTDNRNGRTHLPLLPLQLRNIVCALRTNATWFTIIFVVNFRKSLIWTCLSYWHDDMCVVCIILFLLFSTAALFMRFIFHKGFT